MENLLSDLGNAEKITCLFDQNVFLKRLTQQRKIQKLPGLRTVSKNEPDNNIMNIYVQGIQIIILTQPHFPCKSKRNVLPLFWH